MHSSYSGTRVNCTVWADLAKAFDTQIKEYQDTVFVCVIRFACLKEWKGNNSIFSAFNSTDIMINPVMPEVDEFRKKLPTDAIDLVQLDDEPSPQKSKVTLYEEFFIINEKSTMDQIVCALETRTCVTIAKISSVEVLPKCCGVCDVDVTDVDYNSQKIKLLFFDGLAQLFIGKKAEELALEKSKEDITAIPESLSVLVWKTMLFKISITSDNLKSDKSAYAVEKFWEKDDMVVQFGKELFGRNELSNISSDTNDHKLQIAPAETSLSSSKRDHTESDVVSNGGHSMKTRKKIKTEPRD
ncbi:PREDICTED: uncharacterized protein LOC104709470 [Camelina sativa]|uniref:Uncharacterized protein LOC104709470 n=1 Tax=Camelina sativa TaxID=90675 RepID=A0ABM0TCV5_CAMSA|nr:PREDICTED: uncharacterized protein LOC104709470 [Camelina sativa]